MYIRHLFVTGFEKFYVKKLEKNKQKNNDCKTFITLYTN